MLCANFATDAQIDSTLVTGPDARRTMRALRLDVDETIELDGQLNELVWKRAVPASDFIQADPRNGSPASQRTEVRIAFDRENLYMGVLCFDTEPNRMKGNQMLRDGFLPADDRFMWTIDPFLNGINGYFFETNPSGAMGDALIMGSAGGAGGATNIRGWDGIWYEKARRSETGWTLEIKIPFRTLAFDPNATAWGINFQRTVKRINEDSLWTGWRRNENLQRMANAGLLEGISDVTQGKGIAAQPYIIGKMQDTPGQPTSTRGTYGGDFIYSVTPQLKATFTLNTDFAETEVDQRQVNLTQFPLFFPEKRTFFLEGANFLGFSREPDNLISPYFSRTIGLNADGTPQPINYGAKVTGQVGRFDLGFLQVQTANSDSKSGEDFTVFRGRRRFFRQSYAGVIFTRRSDRRSAIDDRMTSGADFSLATSTFRGSKNLELSGFYLASTNIFGTPGGNGAYGLRLDYPNDRWSARMAYRVVQPNWNPAAGFLQRRDIRHYNPVVQFAPRPANSRFIRRYTYAANLDWYTDLNNVTRTRQLDLTVFGVEFQTGDNIQAHVLPSYENPANDFNISKGVLLGRNVGYNFTRAYLSVNTASRRPVSLFAQYNAGSFFSGDRKLATFSLTVRPRDGVNITTDYEWNRVELAQGKFTTTLYRVTANTQLNPWVSLANNIQYDNVSRLLGWQSRFRWIVRPGNDVYFVYSHNWLNRFDPDARGLDTISRSAASKVVYSFLF